MKTHPDKSVQALSLSATELGNSAHFVGDPYYRLQCLDVFRIYQCHCNGNDRMKQH